MADQDLHRVAFPTLDDVQVATLAKFGTRRALRDGELLFKAGARAYNFFVVERGAVEIVEHSSGEPKTVTLHKVHAFGGDVSLVTGRPALISAVARGNTEVFEIAPSDIRRIMSERPALGELLLRAFIARRELLVASDFQGLRVLGAGSSRDTFRIRDFLARNQVPFTWIDVDHDPQVGELLRSFGLSEADTPVVVFGSEPLLRNPSTRALADLIGVRRPLTQRVYDLVIVGGGPAGLAAAVYASSEGLATAVIDATAPGGQAGTSSKIENYLGFPTGISGTDLANRAIFASPEIRRPVLVPLPGCAPGLRERQARPLVRRWRACLDSMRVDRDGSQLSKIGRPKARTVRGLGRLLRGHPDGSATVPRLGGHCGRRGQLRRASRDVSFRPHAARALAPP
jgi:thioredoxin reductase (NADPH)